MKDNSDSTGKYMIAYAENCGDDPKSLSCETFPSLYGSRDAAKKAIWDALSEDAEEDLADTPGLCPPGTSPMDLVRKWVWSEDLTCIREEHDGIERVFTIISMSDMSPARS